MKVHIDEKEEKKPQKLLDTRLMAGPLAERGCTDIIFCLLFIASIIIMWGIAITGYSRGKPWRLAAAYDPDKKACGLDYPDYPYIYFPILESSHYNYTVCVKSCPGSNLTNVNSLQCQPNQLIPSCNSNCGLFDFTNSQTLTNYPGSFNISKFFCIYETQVRKILQNFINLSIVFDRLCFPKQALSLLNQTTQFNSDIDIDRMTAWVSDLGTAKYMILGSFFIAFFLGFIYMILVRYFSGLIVWLSIILYFVSVIILGVYLNIRSNEYYQYSAQSSTVNTNTQDTARALQITSYIVFAFTGLSFVIFVCMFNKIRLAIAIIKTATLFVKDNFSIIFVPPIISIALFILWLWWIISVIFIIALGDIKGQGTSPFASVTWDTTTRRMFWYFVFGGLWKNAFLMALCQFIIGSSVCIWYFSQGSGQGNHHPIRTSIYRAFRYHLGSIAFGSLILAIVQFIRIILEYAKWQAKKISGDNRVTKLLLDCLSCYVLCFERFIEFLNKNAYIQIALTGKSFCPAAKEAFETVWANAARYSLVSGIGGIFNFIGKLFISITTVMIAYMVFTHATYYVNYLFSPVVPSILVFVISYGVAILFLSIYSMACDSILVCYVYDEDLNKQNGGSSAQHCPETLREFFEKKQ